MKIKIAAFVVGVMIAVDLYLIFGYAPVDANQGLAQKIFYWHVSSAFTMFASVLSAGACSVLYLIKRKVEFDRWGLGLVEVGFLFCTIVLLTGPVWAKPIWGVWWTWEPRLTSTLFIWMILLSYFIVRDSISDMAKKRVYCAIITLFGCMDIPIIVLAVKLWRGVHPIVLNKKTNMPDTMWFTFLFTLATVMGLGALLTYTRVHLEKKK